MSLKIAIIGAGPAGTALARILTQSAASSSLSVTIFEGEKSLDVRSQGGTLDLRQGTGLDAIRAANLYDEFLRYARFDGESLVVCDKNLVKYIKMDGDPNNKNARAPEIDRHRLRQILLDSLPDGVVSWGKRLIEVREDAKNGSFALHFRDGSVAEGFDLVVGADGAWSKVRPLLTNVTPVFTGVAGYAFLVSDPETKMPEAHRLTNRGSVFAMHDQKWISLQQMGDGTISGSTYFVVDSEDWTKRLPFDVSKDHEAVRDYNYNDVFPDWDATLKEGIKNTDLDQVQTRNMYMLPVGHRWKHRRGVTLIGDAAHLMTPFAGEGVNQALTDAKELANEIVTFVTSSSRQASSQERSSSNDGTGGDVVDHDVGKVALDKGVETFEKEMFSRMAPIMKKTDELMHLVYFEPGMPRKNIERWVLSAAEDELPLRFITYPLLSAAVYTFYFFFKLWHRPAA